MNKLNYLLLACLTAGVFSAVKTTAATSSNTIVRFQIRHGQTIWGNVDVELFDSLKPITVSNFLSYVRSGAFDRSILHRAFPGFVVQGGQYTVPNPYVTTPANYLNRILEGPAIASEATNSPIIPNTFGTLAMSLSSSGSGTNAVVNRESATTSWYFNTSNNSTDLPEYTVFGKVKSGTQYLTYFNTISEDDGIINMYGLNYLFSTCDLLTIDTDTDIGLQELPVFYFQFDCPLNSDLFNVQISILKSIEDGSDTVSPMLKVVYPLPTTVITTDSLTVTGTVTDNVAIESLRVYLGSNNPVVATVTNTAWSVTLTNLPAGTNFILVEATDSAGNRLTTTARFFYKVSVPININSPVGTGTGITFGITNGQLLDLGRLYTISAKADPTNFFMAWLIGTSPVNFSPNYQFLMSTNLTGTNGLPVYAQFDTNQFPGVKGTYNGLFVSTNAVEQQSSGYFTLTLNDSGSYSAKMIVNGSTISFADSFSTRGISTISPLGLPGYTRVDLSINLTTPNNQLLGIVTNSYGYLIPTLTTNYILVTNVTGMITNVDTVATNVIVNVRYTNNWSAELIADRAVFNSKLNQAPQAGKYTMILPADTNSAVGPAGDGYGTVTVTTAGGITFAGVLPDGTKAAQKTFLSEAGHWPLYVPLYKTNGSLVSWVSFSDEEMTDFSGLFNWFKKTNVAKYYAAGFTNEATIAGSRFTPPNTTNQMLYLTNGTVSFTNGNLATGFANDVLLDPKGKVRNQETNALSLSISSGNGLISGSAKPPGGSKAIAFKGAILQKQTNAAGFFLGTSNSGRVYLGR